MRDENPIRTLGYYSKPSHEGYRNIIELLVPSPLSNNIRRILSEQGLDSRLTLKSTSTMRIESLLQCANINDRINHTLKRTVDYAAGDRLRKMSAEKAWATIEELARYEDEGWNDPTISEKGGLNYKNLDLKQLLRIIRKLKEEIRMEENRTKKIKKITRYPNTKVLEPLNSYKFSEVLTEKASFHTPKFVSPKSICVKHVQTIFPSPPFVRESIFGFEPGRKAYLLEDKQISSAGVFDEHLDGLGGNTRDLGSFREETNEITNLYQILEEVLLTERGNGVACIKRRRHDPSGDGVRDLVTTSEI
ncbi:hypothetical protein Tco_1275563 [Tanacetum coccineum]